MTVYERIRKIHWKYMKKHKSNDFLIGRLLFQIRYAKREARKEKGIDMHAIE